MNTDFTLGKGLFLFLILFSLSTPLWGQYSFTIETDTTFYDYHQPIVITMHLLNTSNSQLEFTCPYSVSTFYYIEDELFIPGGLDAIYTFYLDPDEVITFTETHHQGLDAGYYMIRGGLSLMYDPPIVSGPLYIRVLATEAEEDVVATALKLQNYPNPFNPSTTISFNLPENGAVSLDIYDLKGKKVKSLLRNNMIANMTSKMTAGEHQISWNGCDDNGGSVASGIYFYKLKSGKSTITKKMILMK